MWIPDIGRTINYHSTSNRYTVPDIGRTGYAHASGVAISMATTPCPRYLMVQVYTGAREGFVGLVNVVGRMKLHLFIIVYIWL